MKGCVSQKATLKSVTYVSDDAEKVVYIEILIFIIREMGGFFRMIVRR